MEVEVQGEYITILLKHVLVQVLHAVSEAAEAHRNRVVLHQFELVRRLVNHEVNSEYRALDVLDWLASFALFLHFLAHFDEPAQEWVQLSDVCKQMMDVFLRISDHVGDQITEGLLVAVRLFVQI